MNEKCYLNWRVYFKFLKMLLLRFLCLLCLFTADIRASSHWVVTESGLIQPKEDSPFLMAKPYDLLSFVNQEIRWQNTFTIYDKLFLKQKIINSLWTELEEQSDVTSHITRNENCKAVGEMENVDWHASIVEDGKSIGISDKEYMFCAIKEDGHTDVPDCKKISSLTFSMATFEHLEGMINRDHLNATPETTLPQIFSKIRTVNQYGHWLSEVLRKNTTSWLHYNLAAIYWRIKGNAPKALECSRRAVHYSPRCYKPIPLLGMGSVLHRSKKTEDAIVVLGAAVDHAPTFPLSHFALGAAYAVMGDFNSSIKHLNTSIKLRIGFDLATKYQNAVLCHIDLFTKMQYTQRTLDKLNIELEEFRELETKWFKIHAAFLKTMKHEKEYNHKNIERNCIKMEEMTQLKIKHLQKDRDRNTLMQYMVSKTVYTKEWKNQKGGTALHIAYDLEKDVKRTVKQSAPPNIDLMDYKIQMPRNKTEILKEIGPTPSFPDMFPEAIQFSEQPKNKYMREAETKTPNQPEVSPAEQLELATLKKADDGKVMYPSNMRVNRNNMDFDTESEWPTNTFCHEAKSYFPDSIETVFPVFMPFEHKGILLKALLTDKIKVSALVEHELPWHPPLCPNDKELTFYTMKKGTKVLMIKEAIAIDFLRFKLLTYVSHDNYDVIRNKQDAEIGHRIYTVMNKKLAAKWIVYTLASLYWRVRGNSLNALNCLLSASRHADARYRDVVLVSLASVFMEMGLLDDSLETVEEGYKISPYEPSTNFLLAQLHMLRKNQMAQFFHLKQVLRVDPYYMGGYARNLLNAWACIAKQVNTLKELGDYDTKSDLCAETEPGVSMVCERDGTNCRLTNRQCISGPTRDSSTLVRMLELKDDNIQKAALPFSRQPSDKSFNKFINIKPSERKDKAGHQKSYDMMLNIFSDQVALCKKQGCGVNLEMLDLKREDCTYNVMSMEYWLHFVCFQLELGEEELQMSADVARMIPSNKKMPECRVPLDANEDFFLSRILAVDTDDWGTLPTLMQQFGELFGHYDYGLLGAKLAKYVETKPRAWSGLVAAGWWCGAGGRGACASRCLAAAHALAPAHLAHLALRPLHALLHLQSKPKDAMNIAYLSFYTAPKNKAEALLVGLAHNYKHETNEALWMYRYALSFDSSYVPATACLHTAMCQQAFGKDSVKKQLQTPN